MLKEQYTFNMFSALIFYIPTINLVLAITGCVMAAVSVGLIIDATTNQKHLYQRFVDPYVWDIILATTIGGVLATLLYSEVFGFVPCSLCWLQRVALYSQALTAATAWWIKDRVFFPIYGTVLAAFGLIIAIYQYIYQMLPKELLKSGALPCLTDGSADCSQPVMEVFGFVTFPLLSAFSFVFLMVLYYLMRQSSR